MKKMFVVLVAVIAALTVVGIGSAVAARGPQSTVAKADCPYAKDGAPIRARDGSGQQANRATTKAKAQVRARNANRAAKAATVGAKQRVRAQDGTGLKARTDVPRGDCDGTGPHGPYRGGR